jgi:hypothetical protein
MANLKERGCRPREFLKSEQQESTPTGQAGIDQEQQAARKSGPALDADLDLESVSGLEWAMGGELVPGTAGGLAPVLVSALLLRVVLALKQRRM